MAARRSIASSALDGTSEVSENTRLSAEVIDAYTPAACERHTRTQHGCRAEGEFRSSRHADGHGRHRTGVVGRLSQAQPREPAVGGPRPLRALERARLDAALFTAAPVSYT